MAVQRRRLVVLGIAYAAIRLTIALGAGPHEHPDTVGYRDFGVDLLGREWRPWVVPLLIRLGEWPFVILQALVSSVAFLLFARTLAGLVSNSRVQRAIAAVVLLVGLTPRITAWDAMLLSESLAVSLTLILLCCLLTLDRTPWPITGTAFTLWLFTRDSHVYLALPVLAGIVVWGWRHRQLVLPAVVAAVTVWGFAASRQNDEVEAFNVTANVAYYAGTDVATFRWFVDHGMPVSGAFSETDYIDRFALLTEDTGFQSWAKDEGQRVYAEYLSTHPGFVLSGFRGVFSPYDWSGQAMVDHADFMIAHTWGPELLWPADGGIYTVVLIWVALLLSLVALRRRPADRTRWLLPTLLMASSVPHALLAWHAAPTELARHALLMTVVLVLSCWWMIALAADVLLAPTADDDQAAGNSALIGLRVAATNAAHTASSS